MVGLESGERMRVASGNRRKTGVNLWKLEHTRSGKGTEMSVNIEDVIFGCFGFSLRNSCRPPIGAVCFVPQPACMKKAALGSTRYCCTFGGNKEPSNSLLALMKTPEGAFSAGTG